MKKAICQTCCRRYRTDRGGTGVTGWWDENDEDNWRAHQVVCPRQAGILGEPIYSVSATRTMEGHPPPHWCLMALEHTVMEQPLAVSAP
jgi:hypothetical protein